MGQRVDATPHLRAISSDTVASDFRLPPHNLEAEQALLGAILVNNEILDGVSGLLSADHFFDPLHGRIFETLATLIGEGTHNVGPYSLAHLLQHLEPIDPNTTVPQYLGQLAAHAPDKQVNTVANDCAKSIASLATRRSLIRIGEELANAGHQSKEFDAIAHAEHQLSQLRNEHCVDESSPAVCAASFHGRAVPARIWHVPDWIPHRNVTLLSGDGGTGKSLLALQLAIATATGGSWLDYTVTPGSVLYVGAEDDLDEMHRRMAAVTEFNGITFSELTRLHLFCLAGKDAVLASFDRANHMARTAVWERMSQLASQIKPRLIIFDTQADLFGGDEISRSQTRQFVQLLRGLSLTLDTTSVLLGHPSVDGMKTGRGTSGSTAWANSVRSLIYMERVTGEKGDEPDPDARALTVKKTNYGRAGLSMDIRWSNGRFIPAASDGAASEMAHAKKVHAEAVFITLLRQFTEQNRTVSANKSPSYAPTIFESTELGAKVGAPALTLAMERLLADHRIQQVEDGPPSKRRGRLIIK